jgi:putative Mg2+ transporter-C (MgtC) family protein
LSLVIAAPLLAEVAVPWVDAAVRLGAAAVLGGAIGAEREHRGQFAGFRTQLLVSLGAALAMVVSLRFGQVYGHLADSAIEVDPARVAYGVMGGVGFLGAGAIVRYGGGVRGLTTAATLWCTAAIGLACGFGMYATAVCATALVVFALLVLRWLDVLIPTRAVKSVTVVTPISGRDNVARLRRILEAGRATVRNVDYARDAEAGTETITFEVALPAERHPGAMLTEAEDAPKIVRLSVQ